MTTSFILALDLSTTHGDLSVIRWHSEDETAVEPVYAAQFVAERSHNAQVFAPLQEALAVIGDQPARLVVGTGPGSYTGVRIAIAATQGVALSRGWPVIGWPSITATASESYHVLGDARRGQFYTVSVSGGRISGRLELIDAETARAKVAAGGDWVSFDPRAPLSLETVRLERPNAFALARHAARLSDEEVQTLSAGPLEPLYLQEAFITTAKKVGKQVVTSRVE